MSPEQSLAKGSDPSPQGVRPLSARGLTPFREGSDPFPRSARTLRVADVAMFYGERSGGIRTYLEAKRAWARTTGAIEHHLVVPGKRARPATPAPGRHELPSLALAASNGYRVPLGGAELQELLRDLHADVVLLHDPYWMPQGATRAAHEAGSAVVAVHHSSVAMHAAGLPGPPWLWRRGLRRWYRRAYAEVDAVMSVVDPRADSGRAAAVPLRMGLNPAFRPQIGVERGDHVLYVGRLSREKGVGVLLEAAAASPRAWPLVLLGSGPHVPALRAQARHLGIEKRVTFAPYVSDPHELARTYAAAACVVMPGAHETFGFVALEAAACGAPAVAAVTAPTARIAGPLVERFRPGDARDLVRAIARARRRRPDLAAAGALASRHSWGAALRAELADLEGLLSARARSAAPAELGHAAPAERRRAAHAPAVRGPEARPR